MNGNPRVARHRGFFLSKKKGLRKQAYEPGSVPPSENGGNHLSSTPLASRFVQPTRDVPTVRPATSPLWASSRQKDSVCARTTWILKTLSPSPASQSLSSDTSVRSTGSDHAAPSAFSRRMRMRHTSSEPSSPWRTGLALRRRPNRRVWTLLIWSSCPLRLHRWIRRLVHPCARRLLSSTRVRPRRPPRKSAEGALKRIHRVTSELGSVFSRHLLILSDHMSPPSAHGATRKAAPRSPAERLRPAPSMKLTSSRWKAGWIRRWPFPRLRGFARALRLLRPGSARRLDLLAHLPLARAFCGEPLQCRLGYEPPPRRVPDVVQPAGVAVCLSRQARARRGAPPSR